MDGDLNQARRGDREAMARIVDRHYDAVFRFCARRIGADLAEDAAQETFISAQRRLRSFQGASSLSTWLFGIAHNHCRNLARKRKTEMLGAWVSIERSEAAIDPSLNGAMDRGGARPQLESQLIDREALRVALSSLSADHREVVVLHEVEGLTYEEAAEVIGIPVGTVKSRLHHAFLKLREALCLREEVTA
ncbi:MAG: RNA polymerase sigma factor [Armatimonadetes bacterium]|nr:RNA polymerase sigma factor [Armatimonadota bacterium]